MSSVSAVTAEAKDWHASKDISERARYLLEHSDAEIPSDVTFLVGDGEDEPQRMFKCHKFLLAMVSPMFQSMFYGSFLQTDGPKSKFRTSLQRHSSSCCGNYSYGEDIGSDDVEGVENALDSLYCAKKYLIDALADICRNHIQFHMGRFQEDPCVVFQRAPQMDEEDLAGLALARIALNTYEIMEGDDLLRLSFDCLKKIVDYPHLNAEEPDIYRGVRRWVEHHVEAVQGWTLRDAFGSLLYSIRFSLFNSSELTEGLVADGILNTEETTSVLQFLLGAIKPVLPFLSTPRSPLPAPFMCIFTRLSFNAMLTRMQDTGRRHGYPVEQWYDSNDTKQLILETRPDLAPECCAFLRHLVEAKVHIQIAFYITKRPAHSCGEHRMKIVPVPAALVEEGNVVSHSVKGACWLEWEMKRGSTYDFRIGTGRKPHPHHSAVFGFLLGLEDGDQWEPFELWDDKRIKDVDGFDMCLSQFD